MHRIWVVQQIRHDHLPRFEQIGVKIDLRRIIRIIPGFDTESVLAGTQAVKIIKRLPHRVTV